MSDNAEPPAGVKVLWARQDYPPVEDAPYRLPGVIADALPDGWVLVTWADKVGWRTPDAVYEMTSLELISDEEFERAVREVRETDWPGLPPGC